MSQKPAHTANHTTTTTTSHNMHMAMSSPSKPLTTSQILQESIKLPAKNRALVLPILLLHLLSSYLLYFLNHLSITPLLTDIVHNSIAISFPHNSPHRPNLYEPLHAIRKDFRELIIVEFAFLIISFAVSCVLTIATIYVLSCTHTRVEGLLTHRDVLSKLRRTFRGPMITQLYIGIFRLGYLFLALASAGVLSLFYHPNSPLFLISTAVQALIILLVLSYLAVVWFISVVISVVEEDCYGLIAIGKAAKLVRGKRTQGTLIVFVEVVAMTVIHVSYYRSMVSLRRSSAARLAVGFVYIAVYLVMNLIVWATSTVFYHECVKIHGEFTEIAMDGGYGYASLSTDTGFHVDGASSKLVSEEKC